jgi:hypothetical protein
MVMMSNEHHYSNTGEHVIHKELARMTSMGVGGGGTINDIGYP